MNLAVALGLVVLVGTVGIAVVATLYLRSPRSRWPAELAARQRAIATRLAALRPRLPARPSPEALEVPAHPAAAEVLARLLAGDGRGALSAAERALAERPDDGASHLLVARALVACDELDASRGELAAARRLGSRGPMVDYLEGRIAHARYLERTNPAGAAAASSPLPAMISPFEVFILELEQHRQRSDRAASLWLAGLGNQTLGHDQILALITDHFAAYFDALESLLAACEAAPGFADALYALARVALKAGFIDEGRALFDAIEPLMVDASEAKAFARDLASLRDEAVATEVANLPTIGEKAVRSVKLRILS